MPKSRVAYLAAQAYVNWHRGENNRDVGSNGEELILRRVLPQCRVVFDVGANVGDWAELALAINPTITLHCFEPISASFAQLEGRGLRARAALNRAALSDADGEVELTVFGETSPVNSMVCAEENSLGRPQGLERTPALRFDTYVEREGLESVDFVKLDVEGAEMLVLRGMEDALRAGRVNIVQFEYGRPSIYGRVYLRDYLAFFKGSGFRPYKMVQDHLYEFEQYHDDLESFEYQNWVAVRRGSAFESLIAGSVRRGRPCPT